MLKHLMNGGSLLSYALYDGNDDNGNPDPKAKLREQIAKGNLPPTEGESNEQDVNDKSDNEGDDTDKEEGEEGDDKEKEEEEELTVEQKAAKEAEDKAAAKLQRKNDRMQRRIDEAVAKQKAAEAKAEALEAQLAADPDKALTAEEIKRQAKAIADETIAAKELADLQAAFQKDCDTLQSNAKKIDKDFDDKINDVCEQFGRIPSFMIGVLKDLDNGGEVLAHVANDDDIAEEIWKATPAKMTRKLVEISNKLEEAKKRPKKEISKVPEPGTPVNGGRSQSNVITQADTKNMDSYVRKRQAQLEEKRKSGRF